VTEIIHRWRGPTWTAMLTRMPYGLHFSVGGAGRLPTDAEVDAAFAGYKFGLWVEEHLIEITELRAELGEQVNPWVRQFVPDQQAEIFRTLVREKRARNN